MKYRDYYEVLGVSKPASDAEIKKAYRRLAMKHHPDRSQDDDGAEARFKEAREAYEVLKDSQKRSTYDQFGHEALPIIFRVAVPHVRNSPSRRETSGGARY